MVYDSCVPADQKRKNPDPQKENFPRTTGYLSTGSGAGSLRVVHRSASPASKTASRASGDEEEKSSESQLISGSALCRERVVKGVPEDNMGNVMSIASLHRFKAKPEGDMP